MAPRPFHGFDAPPVSCGVTGAPLIYRCATPEHPSRGLARIRSAATRANRHVLIGTGSVDASEHVGALLKAAGLDPVILNARQDRDEAEIVAAAGQPGRVTVATNMAGRGSDIKLHPAARQAGGLHVIMTECHESGRIDRQLFGRAGRQGDPGTYESIVALDDELFQRFVGRGTIRLTTNILWNRSSVPRSIARVLKYCGQMRAERIHGRVATTNFS
jgi:preprotein translocase subunit SecA